MMNNNFIQIISEDFKDILFIEGQRNGMFPFSNSILINDYLIDTGISNGFMRKLKRSPLLIKNVILSHWHEDHTSSNRLLKSSEFFCHIYDKDIIENVDKIKEFYGVINTPAEDLIGSQIDALRPQNTIIKRIISDEEIIKIGENFSLKVIHIPGHTAGHCAFYEQNSKIAFFSDINLPGLGPWYGGIDSNLKDFKESLNKLKKLNVIAAVLSHGPSGLIKGRNQIINYLEKMQAIINRRNERILEYFYERRNIIFKDLLEKNIVFKKYTQFKVSQVFFEGVMIRKHIQNLLQDGIIEKDNKGYVLS